MTVIVTPPLAMTDSMLISSTVPEPDASLGEVVWTSATYALGNRRIVVATHRVYECTIAGASAITPQSDPTRWLDVGPTNRWAMFDLDRNTATIAASPLTVVIRPGARVGTAVLVGLDVTAASITQVAGGNTTYTTSANLVTRRTLTATDYCFGPFGFKRLLAKYNLPLFTGAELTITMTKATGSVKCGGVVLGTSVNLGPLLEDVDISGLNFSQVQRDGFGNAILKAVRRVPTISGTVFVAAKTVAKVKEIELQLDAKPAFWNFGGDYVNHPYYDVTQFLGHYQKFQLKLDNYFNATLNLTVEEI